MVTRPNNLMYDSRLFYPWSGFNLLLVCAWPHHRPTAADLPLWTFLPGEILPVSFTLFSTNTSHASQHTVKYLDTNRKKYLDTNANRKKYLLYRSWKNLNVSPAIVKKYMYVVWLHLIIHYKANVALPLVTIGHF